jgi:hypothetical protein
VDGHIWSDSKSLAGLRLKAITGGKEIAIEGGDPVVSDAVPGHLHISWPLKSFDGKFIMDIEEQEISMRLEGDQAANWYLDLNAADGADLPFTKIDDHQVDCQFKGMDYHVRAAKGSFSKPGNAQPAGVTSGDGIDGGGTEGRIIFKIKPEGNAIDLRFNG